MLIQNTNVPLAYTYNVPLKSQIVNKNTEEIAKKGVNVLVDEFKNNRLEYANDIEIENNIKKEQLPNRLVVSIAALHRLIATSYNIPLKSQIVNRNFENLQSQIDSFKRGTFPRSDTFTLTTLSPLYKTLGYTNESITFDQTHMGYSLFVSYKGNTKEKLNHYMGEEFFKNIDTLLNNPIAIVPSNTKGDKRQLIILDHQVNGSYVCAAIRSDGQGMKNSQAFPSTHILSFCAKEKADYILSCRIKEEIEHQKYANKPCGVYYIDNKKAIKLLNGKDFELSRSSNLNGYINSIQGKSLIVNKNSEKIAKKGANMDNSVINTINAIKQIDDTDDVEYTLSIVEALNKCGINTYITTTDKLKDVVSNTSALNKNDVLPYFTLTNKMCYGYSQGNNIFLTENGINKETLFHEYTHLWLESFRISAPEYWEKIKNTILEDKISKYDIDTNYKIYDNYDRKVAEYLCDYVAFNNNMGVITNETLRNEEAINYIFKYTVDDILKASEEVFIGVDEDDEPIRTFKDTAMLKTAIRDCALKDLFFGVKLQHINENVVNFKIGNLENLNSANSQNHKITNFENLEAEISAFKNGTFPRTDTFTLTTLSPLYKTLGYTNENITFDQTHMRYSIFNAYNGNEHDKLNHFMGEEFFKNIDTLLNNPIAIVPSNTKGDKRQLIILDHQVNGSYVCASVRADGVGLHNGEKFPSTHIFSLCAKEKAGYILCKEIEKEIEHQKYPNKPCGVYYIDNKKAIDMSIAKGFQLPRGFTLNGYMNNIQGKSLIVNKNFEKNEEIDKMEDNMADENRTASESSLQNVMKENGIDESMLLQFLKENPSLLASIKGKVQENDEKALTEEGENNNITKSNIIENKENQDGYISRENDGTLRGSDAGRGSGERVDVVESTADTRGIPLSQVREVQETSAYERRVDSYGSDNGNGGLSEHEGRADEDVQSRGVQSASENDISRNGEISESATLLGTSDRSLGGETSSSERTSDGGIDTRESRGRGGDLRSVRPGFGTETTLDDVDAPSVDDANTYPIKKN